MQNYHRNTFELFTLRRIVCTYIQIKYQQWIQMKHNSVPKIKTKPADMTKWPLNEIKWIPRQSDEDTLQACSVAWERGDLKHNGRFAPWRRKKTHCGCSADQSVVMHTSATRCLQCLWLKASSDSYAGNSFGDECFSRRCTKGQPSRLLTGKVLVTKSCWLVVHSSSSRKNSNRVLHNNHYYTVNLVKCP